MTQAAILHPPDFLEASHGQRRIWAAEQSSSRGNAQIIPLAYRIDGPLDTDRLAHSISSVVAAHEALHTGLIFHNGGVFRRPCQRPFRLEIADFRWMPDCQREDAVQEKGRTFFSERFDLAGDPMLRALLIAETPARQLLLIAIHHSAGDGASFDLLQEQISRLYRGEASDVVFRDVRPFSAYVAHSRARELAGEFDEALDEAMRQLAPDEDLAETQLPPVFSHPRHPGFKRFDIEPQLHASVVDLSKHHFGLGPAAVYLTAFHVFLCTLFDRRRSVIGFPVSNRTKPGDENIVGFMTNIVPVQLTIDAAQSLRACLAAVGKALFGVRQRFDLPYGLFLQRLHGDPFRFDTVPFEGMLTYQPRPASPLQFSGCKVSAVEPVTWPVTFELMLDIEENDDSASALVRWNAARHSSATVEVLREWYPWLLEQLCQQPDRSILEVQQELRARLLRGLIEQPHGSIDLDKPLPAKEMSVLHGAKTGFATPVEDVFSIFESHARRTPNHAAATDQQTTLSYGELLRAAEQIDQSLAERGVAPGDGIAICMKRRPALLAALLGVVRRRAFFVPLDANQPLSRLLTIMCEAAPKLILCDLETSPILKGTIELPLLCVEDILLQNIAAPLARPHARSDSDAAYLLYTSGSTGVPKGVEVGHAALMNYLAWAAHRYEIERGSGAVVFSSIAFDMTVTSLFVPLFGGRTVHLIAADDFEGLARFLEQTERLSFLKLTPGGLSLLGELMSAGKVARATRHIVLGGEQVQAHSLRCVAGADDLLITNEYGPTETTVGSVAYTFKPSDAVLEPVPIGTPLWNTAIAIVHPPDRIAVKGMTGEIAIGGVGVAAGYRNRADETAERFRPLPAAGDGAWYFTGDLGFLRDDGQLVYQGRIDEQVKIHGYRIETGEVASILARCPAVASVAVVAARHVVTGKTFLSAFIKPGSAISKPDVAQVHAWAEAHLPSYARPDRVELLDEFPLARSGKIDRKSLVARSAVPVASAVMPPQELVSNEQDLVSHKQDLVSHETALSTIWQQILGRPLSQPHDSFFAMGGDSIKALHFVVAARKKGIHLTIADVLNGRSFDQIVNAAKVMRPAQPNVSRTEGEIPLLPVQRAYFDLNRANRDQWCLFWIFPADGAVDPLRLATAAAAVRNRHPALRSEFYFESSRWQCNVKTQVETEPPEVIHIAQADDESISEEVARQLARIGHGLRLEQGVVAKLCLIDLGLSRGFYLAWVVHHLVVDIVSLQIMARELLTSYHEKDVDRSYDDDDGYSRWTRTFDHDQELHFPDSAHAGLGEQLVEMHAEEVGARITAPDVAGRRRAATLILAALMRSLGKVEGLSDVARVCVERQGRVRGELSFELLNAVGWLTSYEAFDLSDTQVTSTADLIERLHPRLVSDVTPTPRGELPEIALNFLGEMRAQQHRFIPAQLAVIQGQIDGASLLFPLEIVAWIDGARLWSSWRFDGARFSRALVEQLVSSFQSELLDILSAGEHVEPLPADYPEAALSKADLTRILADYQ